MSRLFLTLALILLPALAWGDRYFVQSAALSVPNATIGTTYYIDGVNGSDGNPGTLAAPFKTIGYASGPYSGRLVGGNVFKIKAGTYRERLEFRNATGNTDEAHRIVIGPYGDGEVILDPSDSATLSWTAYDANIYVANCDLTLNSSHVPPNAVIMNDDFKSCRPVYSLASVTSFGKWFYDSAAKKLYVYTGGATPASQKILVTTLDENNTYFGVSITGADYITIYGITITGASSYAINSTSAATKVEQCTIKFSGKSALKTYGTAPQLLRSHIYGNVLMNWPRGHTWNYSGGWPAATAFASGNNGLFAGNIVEHNGGEGFITGGYDATGVVVEDNIVHDNWSVNLYIDGQSGDTMRRNLSYVSAVNASDLVTSDDPTVPTWITWAELQQKLLRRLYPICLNEAVELGEYVGQTILMSNKIYDNVAIGGYAGISTDCETGSTGPAVAGFPNSIIANNTVIMPTDAPPTGFTWTGISWQYCGGTNTGSVIKNNIVTNTRTESFSVFMEGGTSEAGKTVFDNNLYYNPNTATQFTAYNYPSNVSYTLAAWRAAFPTQDVHSISGSPLFTGGSDTLAAAYYVPQSGSPARGSGADLSSAFTVDFNGYTKAIPMTVGALDYGSVYTVPPSPPVISRASGRYTLR